MDTEQELNRLLERYKRLEPIVDARLDQIFDKDADRLMLIMHRIKTEESIKEKMERKQGKYQSIHDMTDILGFRIICFFSNDVDRIAQKVSEHFRVNWNRTKDKRKLIDARAFGYLSLHYICALPDENDELSDLWFEIQIKTILQHSWAEIEHDLGYKSEIEVPWEIRRGFSKAASLLETADDIFSGIYGLLDDYKNRVKTDVESESLDDLFFDRHTITEYTLHNRDYRNLLDEIASITDAHITEGVPKSQLPLIRFFGIETLGDMSRLIREKHDLTMELARKTLQDSGLDELISTVAYYYLFRAILISGDYSRERIHEFFSLTSSNESIIESNTQRLWSERCNYDK